MVVNDVAHSGVENGVAQKLQALIVDWFTLLVAVHDALVHERHLVMADVAWNETDDVA